MAFSSQHTNRLGELLVAYLLTADGYESITVTGGGIVLNWDCAFLTNCNQSSVRTVRCPVIMQIAKNNGITVEQHVSFRDADTLFLMPIYLTVIRTSRHSSSQSEFPTRSADTTRQPSLAGMNANGHNATSIIMKKKAKSKHSHQLT